MSRISLANLFSCAVSTLSLYCSCICPILNCTKALKSWIFLGKSTSVSGGSDCVDISEVSVSVTGMIFPLGLLTSGVVVLFVSFSAELFL